MRGRLGEAAMVPDDFRSTDTVRFPASLDGLRKHFLDISRVFDAADVDFRRHSICGTEMDAADAAQALVKILPKCNVPDTIQLNLILAQVKAATLDDEFGLGQSVLRKGQRQRKDGAAFSVGPENFFLVQVDAELTVFECGHGMTPFVMGFVLVVGTDLIMSILYHAAMILAIYYTYAIISFGFCNFHIYLRYFI